MSAFISVEEVKGQKSIRNGPSLDNSRLVKHVDYFEREKSAILHQAEKQKHLYRKSLEQLQVRSKPVSPSPLLKAQAANGYRSLPNSPLMAASERSDQAAPSSNGRGSEQMRDKGLSKPMGNTGSPAPFSRYVSNDKLLAGSKVLTGPKRSIDYTQRLSRTPDVNTHRRHVATPSYSPPGAPRSDRGRAMFLSPGDPLRRSVSDRNIYSSSFGSEVIDLKPPEAIKEIRPRSPAVRRRDVSTSSSELSTLLDMLPSINSQPQSKRKRKDVESRDTTDGGQLPANYGMSNRLANAVREIETRLADHKMKLEDRSTKPKGPERPVNILLPDKTRKYHTYMTLPPNIPIPWHLYSTDSDDDDDTTKGEEETTRTERKRSSSFDVSGSEVEKSPLAQQFEEMKHCRYLRQYKPTVKRESWF